MNVAILFMLSPASLVKADDKLCRELVKSTFDTAMSELAYTKSYLKKYHYSTGAFIETNPLHFTKNGNLEVLGAELKTPLVKVERDFETETIEYKPVSYRKSSLLVDPDATKREFPTLSDAEISGCKLQTMELSAEIEHLGTATPDKRVRERTLRIHTLFCGNEIKAYKYQGENKTNYFDDGATLSKTDKTQSHARGFIFETQNGKCVLKSESLSENSSTSISRDDCFQFYQVMKSQGPLIANTSRVETASGACYTKPSEVVRGRNLSSFIPDQVWKSLNKSHIQKLTSLAESIRSRSVDAGNLIFAEGLRPARLVSEDVVKGCAREQVALAPIVEALDSSCDNFRSFVPFLTREQGKPARRVRSNTVR